MDVILIFLMCAIVYLLIFVILLLEKLMDIRSFSVTLQTL